LLWPAAFALTPVPQSRPWFRFPPPLIELGVQISRPVGARDQRCPTALFFGWYHIGNEQLFAATVPAIVALRTVLIILPVGLAFGWLYLRRGLEAAILSFS
jgi:hypothetical protein